MTITATKPFKCPFTPAIIDFSTHPTVPKGYTICSHDSSLGSQQLALLQFELYGVLGQNTGTIVDGRILFQKVRAKQPYPANLLDHFLEHTEDIPEELKGNSQIALYTFFWGTIYFDFKHNKCVRGIYWKEGEWKECTYRFDDEYAEKDESWPANCLALIAV